MAQKARVAYFSMEIGLDATIPTYAGGLGVLAGDTIALTHYLYGGDAQYRSRRKKRQTCPAVTGNTDREA